VAILCLGTSLAIEAEGHDRATLGLPANQQQLAEAVLAANPRTVVVLLNAGPLTIRAQGPRSRHPRSLVERRRSGNAIADVLFGNVNPGGKLPYTVYASEAQVPPQDQYDITQGFTYMYLKGAPLFPFGHGLSYTSFAYSNFKLAAAQMAADGTLRVSATFRTPLPRGHEVVQLYIHQVAANVPVPAKKTRRLAAHPSGGGGEAICAI